MHIKGVVEPEGGSQLSLFVQRFKCIWLTVVYRSIQKIQGFINFMPFVAAEDEGYESESHVDSLILWEKRNPCRLRS